MSVVLLKTYRDIPIRQNEILRYAGCPKEISTPLLDECLSEVSGRLSYKVCYRISDVGENKTGITFDFADVSSENLRKNLNCCKRAVVFAATVGIEIDRLIAKYGRISPAKALIFQAIGAERIESLCDIFCSEINESLSKDGLLLRPRFSPGYGDLPLDFQREIFKVLDCPKKIGLTLNESLLMSPSKSVTAIAGISKKVQKPEKKLTKTSVKCVKN